MIKTTISKPIQRLLTDLTGEARFDVALHLAVKDLIRLKLGEAEKQRLGFEKRYR